MTDIASLGLEIRSDGVVVAKDRLKDFRREAGLAEAAVGSLKRMATLGLAALAAGFAAFGVGIGGAVKRLEEMRKLSAQVNQALKNSGNSARTSAGEIEAWADKLEARTGRAAEEIMGVSANLASFGFSREAFFRSLELADDMSAAWGGDLKQNLEGLARALAEPEKGLAMLTKRGITFSEQQKVMIADFVKANDLAGAQGVVFEALEAQVKGVAQAGFGGLTKSMATLSKAWEDAFDDLVRGDGQASDLTDTLEDLASTLSSPDFIGAVMGFGNMIIQVINGIAQVAIGAAKAFQDFMNLINAPGGAISNFNASTAPLDQRDDTVMAGQLKAKQDALARSLAGNGGAPFGLGAEWDRTRLQNEIAAIEQAIASRTNPSMMDVNSVVGGLDTPTYGSTADMWKALSPGTMAGQVAFNPYEGMDLGGGKKDKDKAAKEAERAAKAYADMTRESREFVKGQELEAQALGMTAEAAAKLRFEQDMLNQAANDNISLGPAQRAEIAGLASEMAAAEEATRRLTEAYDFGKEVFSGIGQDFISGFRDGLAKGDEAHEATRLKAISDLLAEAGKNGTVVAMEQRKAIIEMAGAMADAEHGANSMERAWTAAWDAMGQAAVNVLDKLASKAMDMATEGLWDLLFNGVMSGISGGFGGNFMGGTAGAPALKLGFQTGVPSFAGGGSTGYGARSGGLDGMGGFMAMLHPQETVTDHTRGQKAPANQNQANDNKRGDLYLTINGSGLSEAQLAKAVAEGIREYDGALASKVEGKFRTMQNDPRAADGSW